MGRNHPDNAADRRQVEGKRSVNKRDAAARLAAWRTVLALPEGRLLLWELLEHCSVFTSIMDPSSNIYANAGRQDVGHYVMARCAQADEYKMFLMMTEASANKQRSEAEREAVRIDAAKAAQESDD